MQFSDDDGIQANNHSLTPCASVWSRRLFVDDCLQLRYQYNGVQIFILLSVSRVCNANDFCQRAKVKNENLSFIEHSFTRLKNHKETLTYTLL